MIVCVNRFVFAVCPSLLKMSILISLKSPNSWSIVYRHFPARALIIDYLLFFHLLYSAYKRGCKWVHWIEVWIHSFLYHLKFKRKKGLCSVLLMCENHSSYITYFSQNYALQSSLLLNARLFFHILTLHAKT